MKNRIKASTVMALGVLTLSGCGLLDVSNPNNLVEENIQQTAAASAVVNGAEALVSSAISQIWQPYLIASDELYWIGSRDAWLSLDKGFMSNTDNEFSDGAFPSVGQGRWMADEAVSILTGHAAEDPSFAGELARANFYAGIIYMIIGEVMEDFAFSDKLESGPPIGPNNMSTVLDQAISYLDAAVAGMSGDAKMNALMVRARAKQSRGIWDKIKPSISGQPLVASASAAADALEAIGMAGGVSADVNYTLTYSASTITNSMASWVNDRKENQFDLTLVNVDAANDIVDIAIMDPIDGTADMGFTKRLEQWKQGPVNTKGGVYPPMNIASTRMMHLILAEDALAGGNDAGFTTHINHVRAMDGETPYSGQMDAVELLEHERRTNLAIMGLRLSDMYRFGTTAPEWEAVADAATSPGTRLPITSIEIRANCHMNGQGCGG